MKFARMVPFNAGNLVAYGGTTSVQLVLQSGIVTLLFWDSNIRHPNFQFESMSLKQKST